MAAGSTFLTTEKTVEIFFQIIAESALINSTAVTGSESDESAISEDAIFSSEKSPPRDISSKIKSSASDKIGEISGKIGQNKPKYKGIDIAVLSRIIADEVYNSRWNVVGDVQNVSTEYRIQNTEYHPNRLI